MGRMRPTRDIQPITEFRANAAQLIGRVGETGEPMYLTQHGKSAAVLLDVEAYDALIDQIGLLKDIAIAEAQIAAGKGILRAPRIVLSLKFASGERSRRSARGGGQYRETGRAFAVESVHVRWARDASSPNHALSRRSPREP